MLIPILLDCYIAPHDTYTVMSPWEGEEEKNEESKINKQRKKELNGKKIILKKKIICVDLSVG